MIFFQESVSQSQAGILLRACVEAFRVKIEILFSITGTKHINTTSTYYVTNPWYKNLWNFTFLPKLGSSIEIVEDFKDPPLLK